MVKQKCLGLLIRSLMLELNSLKCEAIMRAMNLLNLLNRSWAPFACIFMENMEFHAITSHIMETIPEKMICEKWHWLPSSKASAILIPSRHLGFMKTNFVFSCMSKCNLIIFALNSFKHPTHLALEGRAVLTICRLIFRKLFLESKAETLKLELPQKYHMGNLFSHFLSCFSYMQTALAGVMAKNEL